MRPTKLTMSAFGPYAGKTIIDFDELGTSGVYLVCGDTGAGKTMIFDAICFALFGEASGDVRAGGRSTVSMRSDYADAASETFAELEFEYRGKSYRVKRSPEYLREKKRGTGLKKQMSNAELELPDGQIVSGVRKVDAQIRELLGIDCEQFKQIVMLAQGEFRKLLTADTATREAIFRKLFGTQVYEQLQEYLAEQSRALEREGFKVKNQIATWAQQVRFVPGSSEEAELEERHRAGGLLGEWLLGELKKTLAVDRPAYEGLEQEVERLRADWAESNALLKQVEVRPALEAEKAALGDEVARLEAAAPILASAFEEQMAHDAERANATERAAVIEGTFAKYEELEVAQRDLDQVRKRAGQAKDAHAAAEAACKQAADGLAQLSVRAAQLKGIGLGAAADSVDASADADVLRVELADALAQARGEHERAERALADARGLAGRQAALVADLQSVEGPYQEKAAALAAAEQTHDADAARLSELQKLQRAGRAGLLAADLQEGMPCPVCGSTHHPRLAHAGDAIPTDAELDAAAEAEARTRKAADAISLEAQGLKVVIEERRSLLERFERDHGSAEELTKSVAQLEQALAAAVADEEAIRSMKSDVDAAKAAQDAAHAQLARAAEDMGRELQAEALLNQRVRHLRGDLEFDEISSAKEEATRLRARAAQLKQARDAAEHAVTENASARTTKSELLRAKEKQLSEMPVVDTDATRHAMEELRERAERLKADAQTIKTRIDANEGCSEGLASALEKAGDIEERYGRVKMLADVATGNLAGQTKVRFEAYVQAIYFDKVIAAANERLRMLTSGQLELIRYSEGTGNAKAGLGLYVIDGSTGRAREASSLSGGESFQASLCLALGLSDIVQSHAGGIEFDTMFVDEGFGSLDQDALGNAISLLADLSSGTKLVGIISHVEDLKSNIPKKIVVTKTRTGSSAEVVR